MEHAVRNEAHPVHILLVQPRLSRHDLLHLPGRELPLSLCYLASSLHAAGLRSAVVDLGVERKPLQALRYSLYRFRPRVVGIAGYTPNITLAGEAAGIVRDCLPETTVVVGGPHPSALPVETLREFPGFDFLIAGEAEETLARFVRTCLEGRDPGRLPGVYRREGDGVVGTPPAGLIQDLDRVPFPDRAKVRIDRYVPDPGNYASLPSSGILFSRGCPFHCTFCSKAVHGDRIRYRSPENLIEEILECGRRFGIHDFRFNDDAPTVDMKRMRSFSTGLLERGIRISWNCFSRVDSLVEDDIRLLQAAGCYRLTFGVESGSPRTLERIRKRTDLATARRACAWARRLGMEYKVNLIVGFPWETREDVARTLALARSLDPDYLTLNLFKPFPGSELFAELSRNGELLNRNWDDYYVTSVAPLFRTEVPLDELQSTLKRAWYGFYFHPRFILRRLRRIARSPRMEVRQSLQGLLFLLKNVFR